MSPSKYKITVYLSRHLVSSGIPQISLSLVPCGAISLSRCILSYTGPTFIVGPPPCWHPSYGPSPTPSSSHLRVMPLEILRQSNSYGSDAMVDTPATC
eukprot:scaffold20893_cov86-Cyclotella_meneghiniana.AAC.2